MRPQTIAILIPLALLTVAVPGPLGPQAGSSPGHRAASIKASDFLTGVDHPYFPLVPGTTFEFVERRGKHVSEIETVVTDETRMILGVTCFVVTSWASPRPS